MEEKLFELTLEDELRAVVGYRVPRPFLELLQFIIEDAGTDEDALIFWLDDVAGIQFAGRMLKSLLPGRIEQNYVRYQETPPELFPFATTGVGGIHLGFVVHAPELELDDLPVGELSPSDPGGVELVGSHTAEAFENLISYQLAHSYSSSKSESEKRILEQRREKIIQILEIDPRPELESRWIGIDGNGLPVVPHVPPGWNHVMTSDGVGVLAPREAFPSTKATPVPDVDAPLEDYLNVAREGLQHGWPAHALHCLKEGWTRCWSEQNAIGQLAPLMMEAYEKLGRRSLAAVIERQARRFGRPRSL